MSKKLISTILLLIYLNSPAIKADEYVYMPASGESLSLVINTDEETIGTKHITRKGKFCNESDDFVCFTSSDLNIAIPKVINTESWAHDDNRYHVIRQICHIDKESKEIVQNWMVIGSRQDNREIEFVFDFKKGLTLISMWGEDERQRPVILLLDGVNGYGAASVKSTLACQDFEKLEERAIETAILHIGKLCKDESAENVMRVDMAHGGAWLIYIRNDCGTSAKYYLVYVSADGKDILNFHQINEIPND